MAVLISLLRGVNLGPHQRIPMDALRELYKSLKLQDVQTHIVSGNVVFSAKEAEVGQLGKRIEGAIERKFGFRPDVVLRTPAELREVIAKNPFASRRGVEPGKLLVTFLADPPSREAREAYLKIKADSEELKIVGRELYIYYPNGQGRSKIVLAGLEKILKTRGTARNLNTVKKLLEMAEQLEASNAG